MIRSGTIQWQIHDFLSDGNSKVGSMSHCLRSQEKCQKFDLEYDGQGQGIEE